MKGIRPGFAAALVSWLLAAQVQAADPVPFFGGPDPLLCSGVVAEPGDPGSSTQSYCSASCYNGGSVALTCSGSCTAVDQTCNPSSQGGYVQCADGTLASCAPAECGSGLPPCESYHGQACSPRGSQVACVWADGLESVCNCGVGSKWICFM